MTKWVSNTDKGVPKYPIFEEIFGVCVWRDSGMPMSETLPRIHHCVCLVRVLKGQKAHNADAQHVISNTKLLTITHYVMVTILSPNF